LPPTQRTSGGIASARSVQPPAGEQIVRSTGLAQTFDQRFFQDSIIAGVFDRTAGPACELWASPVDFRFCTLDRSDRCGA
jgi:hypothetical protein